MERIGFGPRFGAFLIDLVIAIVLGVILMMAFGISMFGAGISADGASTSWLAGVVGTLVGLAYGSFEIFKASSPGGIIMKLKIKNEDGSEPTQEALIKRYCIKYCASICQFIAALTTIGFIATLGSLAGLVIFLGFFLVLTEPKQTLHDKLSKTCVFRA